MPEINKKGRIKGSRLCCRPNVCVCENNETSEKVIFRRGYGMGRVFSMEQRQSTGRAIGRGRGSGRGSGNGRDGKRTTG